MIVGYDAKRAALNVTGLGNYSRTLLRALRCAGEFPQHLYTPRVGSLADFDALVRLGGVIVNEPEGLWRRLPALWRSWGLTGSLAADDVALFHGLAGELPFNIKRAGIPTVVTIHDLIFRHCPELYNAVDRWIYDVKARRACHDATRIIAISNFTREEIIRAYNVSPDKIDVVYQSYGSQFTAAGREEGVARCHNLPLRYVLSVGTIERRKNQQLAVAGLRSLPEDVALVVVGRRTAYADELELQAAATGVDNRLFILTDVAYNELPALYRGALLSSYTSRIEGFGLPVVESLACGTPCVVATGSCLEEAGGAGCIAVPPDDSEAWALAANRLIADAAFRAEKSVAGLRHVEQFSPANMVSATKAVYERAAEQYGAKV